MWPAWCLFGEPAFGATDVDYESPKRQKLSSNYLSVTGGETVQLANINILTRKLQSMWMKNN